MSCSNCFNGCAGNITPDKCIKYTGVPIPELGIDTGDSLLMVENQIVEALLSVMIGEGVIPIIDPLELCPLVQGFLPVSGDITLNDVLSALIQSVCDINTRLDALKDRVIVLEDVIVILNGPYTIGCLTGVTPTDGTHAILQAVITKLCAVALDLATNYVLISDVDTYINNYITNIPGTSLYSAKMIPYTVVAYYGPTLGNFDITGAGLGDWEKIYLCNGQNNTPDLRGRVIVGATTMGTNPFSPVVDPGFPGNPAYSLNTLGGANTVTLSPLQMPSHTHGNTIIITDPGHVHTYLASKRDDSNSGPFICTASDDEDVIRNIGTFSTASNYALPTPTGLKGSDAGVNQNVVVSVLPSGGDQPHSNIQPVMAGNFIMYIP